MRTGIGFDVHPFAEDEVLILGGVKIDKFRGLAGHSDADVLLHAVMDALLGAAGAGDIGEHFPPQDDRYKNISSLKLLARVKEIILQKGYEINNIDVVVMAEKPRLASYKSKIKENIAQTLDLRSEKVNIKATTTEGLGFIGRVEGIAVQVIVTLV